MFNRLSRLRQARANDEAGFTLIELLVVVVIIGILIAIAIPLYLNYTKGAKDKSAEADLRSAIATMEVCSSDNGSYPTAIALASGATSYSLTGCTGQQLNFSSGTTLTYIPSSTSSPSAYLIKSTNSGGKTWYCYDSGSTGAGNIKTSTTAWTGTTYAAGCA